MPNNYFLISAEGPLVLNNNLLNRMEHLNYENSEEDIEDLWHEQRDHFDDYNLDYNDGRDVGVWDRDDYDNDDLDYNDDERDEVWDNNDYNDGRDVGVWDHDDLDYNGDERGEVWEHNDYDDDDPLEFNDDERDHISYKDDENTDDDSSEVELRDSHIYIPREHANTVLLMLKKQYEQSQNLDLIIKTSNAEIKAHKCLIAACSPYINTYFQNCSNSNSIDLSHLNPECVKKIIDWCYSGYMKVSISDVQDFLISADFLCIDHVFKNCTDFILKRLTLENCYEIFTLSCNFQACDFKNKVKRYMLNNFGQLFKQDLDKLPKEELVEIIADSSLVLADDDGFPITDGDLEFKLLHIIKKYLSDHSLLNYWPNILKHSLRLSLMSEQQLKEIIEDFNKSLEFEDKKVCVKLLKDSLQCKKSKKPENSIWLKPRINLES